MKPETLFTGRPIRSLQTMLRVLGESKGREVTLIPDGIYGPQTMAAVTDFQRESGLPPTGVADQATWEAVVAAYEPALIYVSEAQPVEVILNANQTIRGGRRHPHVYLVQSMLIVLSEAFESISEPSMTGILDLPTRESLASFQQLSRLPATGELDKITWKQLALQYPLAVNLLTQRPEY